MLETIGNGLLAVAQHKRFRIRTARRTIAVFDEEREIGGP